MFLLKSNMYEACFAVFFIFFTSVQTLQLENEKFLFGGPSKCIEDLGCFSNGPPFYDPIQRPILPLPEDGITTSFLLFNRPDIKNFTYLEPYQDSLQKSTFNSALETKILVHGYETALPWNSLAMHFKDKILDYGNYNVIVVNWTQSSARSYPQAVSNARVVGAQIAKLLYFLHKNASVALESVHLIGHSLGAHVCGWAGERLTNVGRITGTDPAGPYFYNSPDRVRLDFTDALFVDIIHTNGGNNIIEGLGLKTPIGHMDFYVNGGSSQPGCNLSGRNIADQNIISRIDMLTMGANSCSHVRAVQLLIESLNNSACSFISLPCDNWEEFINGECNQRYRRYRRSYSAEMGFHAVKPENVTISRRFFLKTNSASPFCFQK